MKPVKAVAVSGGVDSLVAAFLLKEKGENVTGIHFKTGFEKQSPVSGKAFTNTAELISRQLKIPVKIMDCSELFRSEIVDYFKQSYMSGKTPNPCLLCNRMIKFGAVLDYARDFGANCLATGHYARTKTDSLGRVHLLKGIDPLKDQSYFLAFLTQKQLASACFPLGNMTKADVKALAENKGLRPVSKKESQDVCFINTRSYAEFLEQEGLKQKPGSIVDTNDITIGRHTGLHQFTVGQRRGINCPAGEPYYVLKIDTKNNRLIVGFKNDLKQKECFLKGVNWICGRPESPVRAMTRIRYSHIGGPSKVIPREGQTAKVIFENYQESITPGQGAVFYRDEEVIGGGWIA